MALKCARVELFCDVYIPYCVQREHLQYRRTALFVAWWGSNENRMNYIT